MEAVRTSETSVDIELRTRQYIPEDSDLHTRRRENLKSHMFVITSNKLTDNFADWLHVRAIGIRYPAGTKDFSFSLCVQTGSGAHPASCAMGTGGSFPWG
jgi:hypothetical protein